MFSKNYVLVDVTVKRDIPCTPQGFPNSVDSGIVAKLNYHYVIVVIGKVGFLHKSKHISANVDSSI